MTTVRKGQAPEIVSRDEFRRRFRTLFYDPNFEAAEDSIGRLESIAWDAYRQSRKAPITEKAGSGFADPDYDLSVEWRTTSDRLRELEKRQRDSLTPSRVLLIVGSARNDGTCPGEMSKTFRLAKLAEEVINGAGFESELLDLSRVTSDYDRKILPCKGYVSTAMPLCHWPCSCYPNHALGQVNDWMAEIYQHWTAAHGVIIVTPVYWYQTPSVLKLMIDRLVCADGGNPDPTTTSGKDPEKAKALELAGWPFPKHLAGRTYGLIVHGDVAGIEGVRRALSDWLDYMGLIDAGVMARIDRMLGYYEPYATSHDTLDGDTALQEEVRNVARAVVQAVRQLRVGQLQRPDEKLHAPRTK
jgi:multimeric flavodoxin WrbA